LTNDCFLVTKKGKNGELQCCDIAGNIL